MQSPTPLILAALGAWTLIGSVSDLRTRRVPPWALYPPAALGLLWFGARTGWLLALLVFAAWLATELDDDWNVGLTVVAVGLLLLLPAGRVVGYWWLLAYAGWRAGTFGGADAVVGLGIVLWLPQWETVLAFSAGLAVWALALVAFELLKRRRAGAAAPQVSLLTLRIPGLPAFALAVALLAALELGRLAG